MTNGLVVMTPSSIAYSGTSASINADGSVVFSACTSLSLNGVFTGDYDNYMVTIGPINNSSADELRFRYRASGSDNSTANSYVVQRINASSTTVNADRNTADYGQLPTIYATQRSGLTFYLFGPYLAQPTACRSVFVGDAASAYLRDHAGTHNQSTSYDGISFFMASSTNFSGLVTVFGFNQ